MKMDSKTYGQMTQKASPPSRFVKDCLWAFFVGGAICLLGEVLRRVDLHTSTARAERSRVKGVILVPHRGARIRARAVDAAPPVTCPAHVPADVRTEPARGG